MCPHFEFICICFSFVVNSTLTNSFSSPAIFTMLHIEPHPQPEGEQKEPTVCPVITIFTLTSCHYCTRAKTLLNKKNWTYAEIPIDTYPKAKENMLKACSRLTVPQIFFGDHWIGGHSELQLLDDQNTLDITYRNSTNTIDATVRELLTVPNENTAVMLDYPAPALTEPL